MKHLIVKFSFSTDDEDAVTLRTSSHSILLSPLFY